MEEKVLKAKAVCKKLSISRTSLWRLQKSGKFPAPRSVSGTRFQGWRLSDVESWIDKNFSADKNV